MKKWGYGRPETGTERSGGKARPGKSEEEDDRKLRAFLPPFINGTFEAAREKLMSSEVEKFYCLFGSIGLDFGGVIFEGIIEGEDLRSLNAYVIL